MCPRDPIDIGEAARRIGVTPATLRLYEARGLIRSARSANGYRQYSPEVMRTARLIRRARRAGLSIRQIAEALRQERGALRALLRRHLAYLEQEQRKYQRMKRHLARWLEHQRPEDATANDPAPSPIQRCGPFALIALSQLPAITSNLGALLVGV
jgi:DNA-binding transcriptional MerR regulator